MATKILRVFQEFTSAGYVPMPIAGNIDYGYTIAGTFPGTTPTTFQTDNPDLEVTVTTVTDFYVWIRSHGTAWNYQYTRNVRVYPDSPSINNVVMGIIIANLNNTVPYTGATQNVNLGEYGITQGYSKFDLTPTATPTTEGTMSWNSGDGTLDLIMKGGNVTLQLGQEQLTRVVNKTGSNLLEANYQAVRISGAQGNRLKVGLAQADSDANSAETLGLITETINNNQEGFITTSGLVHNINTTGSLQSETWIDGDMLYLSGSVAGQLTNIKPQAPIHTIIMGYVVRSHATQGQIYVKVDNGYELDELHNVKITTVAENDFLVYDSSVHVWENRQVIKTNGYIPYFDSTDLFKNSIIYTDGTKVRIGGSVQETTALVTINGNLDISDTYSLTSKGQTLIGRTESTNVVKIGSQNLNDKVAIFAGNAERITITSGGLVGINTTTPSALFHIKGTTAYSDLIIDNNSTSGSGAYAIYQNGVVKGRIALSGYINTDTSTDLALISLVGGINFYTNGSSTIRGGFNSAGNFYVGQLPTFLGLGTEAIVRGVTSNGTIGAMSNDMVAKGIITTDNGLGANIVKVGAYSSSPLAFISNNTEVGRFTTSGNFGVGVTPTYKLDVLGDINTSTYYRIGGTQYSVASTTLSGFLTTTDWNTFNNKENAITVGTTAQYWRGDKTWQTLNTSIVVEGTNLYYTQARFDSAFGAKSTTNLAEGTNLYYTDARARGSISLTTTGTSGASTYNSATGVLNIPQYQTALTNPITGTGTTNYLPKFNGITSLTNSLIYDNGINVGIGTTTINGSGTVFAIYNATDTQIRLQSGNTGQLASDGGLLSLASDNSMYLYNYENAPIYFGTNNSIRATILGNGNVGIGTSSPGVKLEVSGSSEVLRLRTSNTDNYIAFFNSVGSQVGDIGYDSRDTNCLSIWNNNSDGNLVFGAGATRRMTLNSSGNLGLGVTPSAWTAGGSNIEVGSAGNIIQGQASQIAIIQNATYNAGWKYSATGYASFNLQTSGQHQWFTAPSGTAGTAISFTQAMTLASTGNLLIGTTSDAGYKLYVSGTVSAIYRTASATAGGQYLMDYGNFSTSRSWRMISDSYNYGDFSIQQSTTQTGTTYADKLIISANGNVGINTSTPSYKLDVSGTGYFGGKLTIGNSSDVYSEMTTSAVDADALFGFSNTGDGNSAWGIGRRNTGEFWIANYTGNFNAGTRTVPLQIASTGAATFSSTVTATSATFKNNSSTPTYIDLDGTNRPSGRNYEIGTGYAGVGNDRFYIYDNTANANRLVIDATGNVGIGTTSPSGKLTVSASDSHIQLVNGSYSNYIVTNSVGNLYFQPGGSFNAVAILQSGNVGIGTTSPSAQLHVASGNVVIGGNPSSQFKLNINATGSKYVSYWIPVLDGVATTGLMSHNGGGYTDQAAMGYQATTHMFNLGTSLTNGGTLQVGGSVNITGTFMINGTPIGTGGGGVSGSGTTDRHAKWSSSTGLTNSLIWDNGIQIGFGTSSYFTDFTFNGHIASGNITVGTARLGTPYYTSSPLVYLEVVKGGSLYEIELNAYNNGVVGGVVKDGQMVLQAYKQSSSSYIRQMVIKSNTIELPSIPTSPSGLTSGDIWKDGAGYLRIV